MPQRGGEDALVGAIVDAPRVCFLARHPQCGHHMIHPRRHVLSECRVGDVSYGPVVDKTVKVRRTIGTFDGCAAAVANNGANRVSAAVEFCNNIASEVSGCPGDKCGGHGCCSFSMSILQRTYLRCSGASIRV